MMFAVIWAVVAALHAGKLIGPQEPAMDFRSFYTAGRAAKREKNFYDQRVLDGEGKRSKAGTPVFPYIYPPFLAEWMSHAPADRRNAARLWNFALVTSAALTIFSVVVVRAGAEQLKAAGLGVVLCLLLNFTDNLTVVGQVNAIISCFVGLAWLAERRRFDTVSGLLLAPAIALKVTPGVLLLLPLVARKWRVVLGAGLGLGVLLAASLLDHGLAPWRSYFAFARTTSNLGSLSTLPITSFGTFSIAGLLARLGVAIPLAQKVATGTALLLLVVLHRWVPRAPKMPNSGVLLAATVAMVLLSPYVWYHHFLFLLPAALPALLDSEEIDGRITVGLLATFAFVSVNWPVFYGTLKLSGHPFGESLPLFGLLAVYGFAVYLASRSERSARATRVA